MAGPTGGQLNPQGHPLHQAANLLDRVEADVQIKRRLHPLGNLLKELHSLWYAGLRLRWPARIGGQGQTTQREEPFFLQIQAFARGNQRLDPLRSTEQAADDLAAVNQMLQIIKNEQQLTFLQVSQHLGLRRTAPMQGQAQRFRQPDQQRVERRAKAISIDSIQREKPNAIPELIQQALPSFQRETGLAHAAWAKDRDQTSVRLGEQRLQGGELLGAAEEGGRLGRQVCPQRAECLERREGGGQIGHDDLEQVLQVRQTFHALLAHITQGHIRRQIAAHQVSHFHRKQNLSTMTGGHDPRDPIERVRGGVVVAFRYGWSDMNPHTHAQWFAYLPIVCG